MKTVETINSIIEWHTKTFPDATLAAQQQKLEDEIFEFDGTVAGTEEELLELADVVIVACGIMRFDYRTGFDSLANACSIATTMCGITGAALWDAVETKMAINRARVWENKNGLYQHKKDV